MGIKHTKVAGGVDNPAYDVSKGEWNDDHDISTLDIVDLSTAETDDSLVLAPDGAGGVEFRAEAGGGGGGVTDADYLVGTSHAGLSAEIVVGTTPGGELGGTWASPTVDATHSGSAHHSAVTVGTGLDLTGQLIDLDLSEVASGGELGGFMDAPTVDATHSGSTHAATQAAAESTAAGALTTHAAAADPHTGYLKESVVSGLAAPGLTLGTTNTAGVALTAIATDSTILAFDATGPAAVGTQAVGAATVAARRDHVHATGAGTPSTQAIGDAAATGSGPAASMTDHKHAMPAFGTGPAAVGTQANGSSANIARIDHVHATGAGTPSTQAFGDAAATGTGPAAAMTDHKHAMPANPNIASGQVVQVRTAISTTDDLTSATTMQDSSLSLAFTPLYSNSTLIIEVSGWVEYGRASGTIATRSGQVEIYNSTDAVVVVTAWRGIQLVATSAQIAAGDYAIGLKGAYTVNSTTTRTFKLRHMSNLVTTCTSTVAGAAGGQALMVIMEIHA